MRLCAVAARVLRQCEVPVWCVEVWCCTGVCTAITRMRVVLWFRRSTLATTIMTITTPWSPWFDQLPLRVPRPKLNVGSSMLTSTSTHVAGICCRGHESSCVIISRSIQRRDFCMEADIVSAAMATADPSTRLRFPIFCDIFTATAQCANVLHFPVA
jgi:hypothetical protein